MADKKLKCVWNMGTPCSDDVEERTLFQSQIKIPICINHYEEHKNIILLHKNHYDVEELLQKTPDDRKAEVLTILLSKLDTTDVEP
jgi:hypothetical protein